MLIKAIPAAFAAFAAFAASVASVAFTILLVLLEQVEHLPCVHALILRFVPAEAFTVLHRESDVRFVGVHLDKHEVNHIVTRSVSQTCVLVE